ncbi:MAG: cation:dicarboxylase symporter family transporter, partial [Negativicutes bacterium]|nr:cation:dicarboxylase symporter family transporter [Negativicutes bacterium]
FEAATTLALIIGLLAANLIAPGHGVNITADAGSAAAATEAAKKHVDLLKMMVEIVPTNIFDGLSRGDMLQIVLFSAIFGIAVAKVGDKGLPVLNLASSVAEVMFKFTHFVMRLAPVGVFALIAYTVGKYGLAMLIPLGKLILTLYGSLLFFLLLVLAAASAVFRVNFFQIIKALKDPILIGFTTASSEAALPLAMERLEQLGIPKHIITFVMPTGYSFNLDGSTLYSALAVVFISQIYGIDFPLSAQILMLLTLMLSTKGIAGVPGTSLVVIAGTAESFGLPTAGVAIILGVDRIMDMARTVCNLIGNCIATTVVAFWEKAVTGREIAAGIEKIRTADDDL